MEPKIIVDYLNEVGEGPLWHPYQNRLYWVDITGGKMFWYEPSTKTHDQFFEGKTIGGFTIQKDGSFLLFMENGSITAATSSPISAGASAILIASESFASEHGLKTRAEFVSRAVSGVHWDRMGMGPLPAVEKALKKANLGMDDIETIESNEAFAAQALYVIRKGGWDEKRVNLNGGAIALGHPLGCSGARIITTLLNVMEQQNTNIGLATMCIGSGQGIATIIKR